MCGRIAIWILAIPIFASLLFPLSTAAEEDLKQKIGTTYIKLVDAEQKGANVTEAANRLNEALRMVNQANESRNQTQRSILLSRAEQMINQVDASIPDLITKGQDEANNRLTLSAGTSLVLIIGGLLAYFYGPSIFWELWLRARGDWKVKAHD